MSEEMAQVKLYQPPDRAKIDEAMDEQFEIIFNMPFPSSGLVSNQLRLVPFLPKQHAKIFHQKYTPEIDSAFSFNWLDYNTFLENVHYNFSGPTELLLAIIDRTKGNDGQDLEASLAGMIAFLRSSAIHRVVEIGMVVVLPEFQRTHVSSHAVGLMLKYALDPPSKGGAGYRRVSWVCAPENKASQRTAARMGFKLEGLMRWYRILGSGKTGNEVDGERGKGNGMHGMLLSLCWDDWEHGGRDVVETQMSRSV